MFLTGCRAFAVLSNDFPLRRHQFPVSVKKNSLLSKRVNSAVSFHDADGILVVSASDKEKIRMASLQISLLAGN
jgi:hypothetical protein